MSKKFNFTENFDPIAALKQSMKENGEPAYEPYTKDGVVQIHEGRTVMAPKVHLDGNAYRNWFLHAFPNGRINVKRHTAPPLLMENGNIVYPQEVFEIEFFLDKNDPFPKASGFGRADYEPSNEFDEISTAITNAFKNGMRNMGFGVDIEFDDMIDSLPKYISPLGVGRQAEFIPIQPPKANISTKPQTEPPVVLHKEEIPVVPEENVVPQVQEPSPAPVDPIIPVNCDILNHIAQQNNKEKAAREKKTAPEQTVLPDNSEAMLHIEQQNTEVTVPEAKQEEPSPAPVDPIIQANNDVLNHIEQQNNKEKAAKAKQEEPSPVEEENPPMFASIEEALDVTVEVLPGASTGYQKLNGKKIRDLVAKDLNYIGKPDLQNWEKRISENTREAAVFVVQHRAI